MISGSSHLRLVGAGGNAERPTARATRPLRDRITTRLVMLVVLLAGVVAGMVMWMTGPATNSAIDHSSPVSAEELEQTYGVRIDVVGLLASGGLVELRFQVVDADKATALFGDVEDMPLLAVEGTTAVLQSAKGMKHSLELLDGASYFLLYTNAGDVVHEGTQVSFVINGIRLPHLVVQQ